MNIRLLAVIFLWAWMAHFMGYNTQTINGTIVVMLGAAIFTILSFK